MAVRTLPVAPALGRATCSNPEYLPLVDAAHARPGGPEAQQMKNQLCRHCPVNAACLEWAMTHGEAGIWGGLSPEIRKRHGAPKSPPLVPRALYSEGPVGVPAEAGRREQVAKQQAHVRKIDVTVSRLAALGVTGAEVKRWAFEQGLVRTVSGRVALSTVEEWAEAHPALTSV